MRKATGCRSCVNYCYCWERSRDYLCTSYKSMYRDSEVTEDEEIDNVCNTADDSIPVGNGDNSCIHTGEIMKEVV